MASSVLFGYLFDDEVRKESESEDLDLIDGPIGMISVVALRLFTVIAVLTFTKNEWPWHGSILGDTSDKNKNEISKYSYALKFLLQAG